MLCFIAVQAVTDSVCRLQQREQEQKQVKVDRLDLGAYNSRAFIIILLLAVALYKRKFS